MQAVQRSRRVRFGAFEADLDTGELRKHGLKIKLQDQPFQVLALLLEHPGEVVAREELRSKLWPADTFVDFDVGLNSAINRLRDALGDTAESSRYVETLPRRGYRFIAVVESLASAPHQDLTANTEHAARPAASTAHRPAKLWIAAGALVGILALLVGRNIGGLRQRLLRTSAAGRIQSIAVLPLENLSGDPAQEYFADGMTEALTTDLGKIGELRVISRTSAMHYKGTRKTLPEIARELNVDAVIEGAVLRSGDRVRITAQLVQAASERQLWAQSYDGDVRDTLVLQSEVARAIASEITVKLTPQEQARLTSAQPGNPEAIEAYLKGRYELSTLQFDESIEHFKQALHKDPNYAQAWAGLAEAYDELSYGFRSQITAKVPAELAERRTLNTELLAQAKAAAIKALQLDESLSEAHVSLGQVLIDMDWSWGAAEKEFQRAITLDPNDSRAHRAYGEHLMAWGRLDEAVAELNRARDFDPLRWQPHYRLAQTLSAAGRYDEALQHWRASVALGCPSDYPLHRRMARAYEGKGMEQEAVAELVAALKAIAEKNGTRRQQDLATLVAQKYSSSGYAEAKKAFLRGEIAIPDVWPIAGPIWMAEDYAELGENDKAFEWLNKTIQINNPNRKFIKTDDRLKTLRADPRFQDLVRTLGFPP